MAGPIFLLEDDTDVAAVLRRALEEHGYTVERFARRADMVRRLGSVRPIICLIDLPSAGRYENGRAGGCRQ